MTPHRTDFRTRAAALCGVLTLAFACGTAAAQAPAAPTKGATPPATTPGSDASDRTRTGAKKPPVTKLVEEKDKTPAPSASAAAGRGSPNMPGGIGTGSKSRDEQDPMRGTSPKP
jgi:hypothetical protein